MGGACPDMVEGCSHLPGLSVGLVVVRVVGVLQIHLGGPPNFGQGAPRRIRSQATAQNHQGPLTLGVPRALELLPRVVNLGSRL